MSWGIEYGVEWGDVENGVDFACALTDRRIFSWHPQTAPDRTFRELACALNECFGEFLEIVDELEDAFDLADAVGRQLDIIGALVGLPRSGYLDARYRTLLEIQIELLLAAGEDSERWSGTINSVLAITRKFIGPDVVDAIVLRNTLPKDFVLTVPGANTITEIETLVFFLTRAVWSEVLGHILYALDSDFWAWDSLTAGDPIPGVGVFGSLTAGAPIADVVIFGTHIEIGVED